MSRGDGCLDGFLDRIRSPISPVPEALVEFYPLVRLHYMHIHQIVYRNVALALMLQSVSAGDFQNLNFEQATIPPTPVGQFGALAADPALAFPGWTMGSSGSAFPNYTLYNNLTLGSVAQVLVGPNYPNAIGYTALEGSYSALLQFGPSPTFGTPALIQTGLVPADARSITFLMSPSQNDVRVTLDGVGISLIPLGGGRMAGDVTAFAGRETQLMFSTTSYNGQWLYFDDVRFSPVAVTEPSVSCLLGLSFILLFSCRRKRPDTLDGHQRSAAVLSGSSIIGSR